MSAVVVLVELEPEAVTAESAQALTFARDLAGRLGAPELVALLLAHQEPPDTGQRAALAAYGVPRVAVATDARLGAYGGAVWAAAAVEVARAESAVAVLAPSTPRGNEVLAHLAARLGLPMAAGVTAVEQTTPFVLTRQIAGGGALERLRIDARPIVASVACGVIEARSVESGPDGPAEPAVSAVELPEDALAAGDLAARVVRVEDSGVSSGALTAARVVVGAGRGAGGPDGFGDLLDLVELLDGALGVSRVVTSLGWRPHHEQVGQTGSRVAPELYLACGISGAIQHWAGMSGSRTVVAVNIDPEAPMVTRAHYAVIGDLHQVVPAVNAEIRRRRG